MSTVADLPESWRDNLMPGTWSSRASSRDKEITLAWFGPFADYLEFEEVCLYTPQTFAVGTGTIERVEPLICPFDSRLYALDVSSPRPYRAYYEGEQTTVDPWAEGADPPWPELVATVRFGVVPFTTGGDNPFLSVKADSNPQRISIPNAPYSLIDEAGTFIEAVAQDVAIPIGGERLTVTWHEVIDLPAAYALTQPIIDTLNLNAITLPSIGLVCAPGTLHVLGRSAGFQRSSANVTKQDFTITSHWRPVDWNRLVASKPPHAGIFRRADPRPIPYADHSVLIRGY